MRILSRTAKNFLLFSSVIFIHYNNCYLCKSLTLQRSHTIKMLFRGAEHMKKYLPLRFAELKIELHFKHCKNLLHNIVSHSLNVKTRYKVNHVLNFLFRNFIHTH